MTTLPLRRKASFGWWVFATIASVFAGTAIPAFAQSEPLSTFNLEMRGGGVEIETESRGYGVPSQGDDAESDASEGCLADQEIRRELSDQGFEDAEIRRSLDSDRVEVQAGYGRWIYGMRVDRCSGKVDGVERIRRAMGGGFGLHFDSGGGY